MRKLFILLAVVSMLSSVGSAQARPEPSPVPKPAAAPEQRDPQFGQHRNERDDTLVKMEKERAKRLNKERQERLKQDTDKLLALATELKQYVDKSNENILSLDVIRKAEEIEKLARQVRDKMKAQQYQAP